MIFMKELLKGKTCIEKEGPVLKENTFDQKRGIELSNQILPIIDFDIKEEKFLNRKNTLHRYFLERTCIKK